MESLSHVSMSAQGPSQSLLNDESSSRGSQCLTGRSDDSACSFNSFSCEPRPIRGRRKDKKSHHQKLEQECRNKSNSSKNLSSKSSLSLAACHPPRRTQGADEVKEGNDCSFLQAPLQVSTVATLSDIAIEKNVNIVMMLLYIHTHSILTICQQQVYMNGGGLQSCNSPLTAVDSKMAKFPEGEPKGRDKVRGKLLRITSN